MSSWYDVDKHELDTDVPVCPHCGWRDEDYWDGAKWRADSIKKLNCGKCEKTFNAKMNEPTFTTWEQK